MDERKVSVKKESLCDWSVNVERRHVGWITRGPNRIYHVRFLGNEFKTFFASFKEARDFALEGARS